MAANAILGEGKAYTFDSSPPAILKLSLPGVVGFSQYKSLHIVKPGDYIYKQGSPATEVLYIEKGLASLVHSSQDPKHSMVVGFANTGKYMGLPEFFKSLERGGINYKTHAIAEAPSKVFAFDHNMFEDIRQRNHNIVDAVAKMLAEMNLKYLERGNLDKKQKVAAYFFDLILYSEGVPGSPVQHCEGVFENDDGAVEIRKSHNQIAEATGTYREFITRLFKEAVGRKLITTGQREIWIHNPLALYEFLGYHAD